MSMATQAGIQVVAVHVGFDLAFAEVEKVGNVAGAGEAIGEPSHIDGDTSSFME